MLDTGVLISGFVFDGMPEEAIRKAFVEAEIYASPELLKEYRDVPLHLEAEAKIDHNQLKLLVTGIAVFVSKAKIVNPAKKLQICRDPCDNMLLECCLASNADFLVTGDKDLLEIKNIPFRLTIVTPKEFVEDVSFNMGKQ